MLKNMKVGSKLFLGFGSLLVLLAVIVIISLISMSAIDSSMKDMRETTTSMKLANAVSKELGGLFRNIQGIILNQDAQAKNSEKEKLTAARERYGEAMGRLEKMTSDETGRRLIENLKKSIADARDADNKVIELSLANKNAEAVSLYNKEVSNKLIPPIFSAIDDILKHEETKSDEMEVIAQKAYQRARLLLIIASIIAIALGIFVALLLTGNIKKPLSQAVETMGRMSKGDLSVAIETDRQDEIGIMLTALQGMANNLKKLISEIKMTTESLASGSAELSASSEEISRNMSEQSGRASQIATAAEQMSQTVIDVAKNASIIAESASAASEKAKAGEAAVNKSIQESTAISQTVNASANVMKNLGEKSAQIGEIILVINDIADQTNLLALNAAIEAARAGEQGRGFAVVADEVRKLAERTAKATSEIGTMIRSVQDEVNEAITSMDTATRRVDTGVALSSEAGSTLREIVSSVDTLQSMVQQIASATEEMSSVAEHISGDVQSIASGANEISSGSGQIAETSSDIARQGSNLQSAVSQFQV
jgi:methyl-accepting chemotaxis protein